MTKRQSEIEIPFTLNPDGESAWAIVDHKLVLEHVRVDEYYLVLKLKKPSLVITKRRPREPQR